MELQLYYFDGCPSWEQALVNLRAAVESMGWNVTIETIDVETNEQANQVAFQGSPSIKYNGRDLWEMPQNEYHLGCRVYRTPQGLSGVPSVQMLRQRLEELKGS